MNVLVKWLLIALAVIVLLAVLAAVLVKTLVDPQQYRALAIDAVERATGRALTLDGEASLKLFPCCAVQIEQATLGNPAGFDASQPFLRLSSARLAIRLWPLLVQREVRIGAVDLQGLDMNLVSLADGRNNWTFATPADAGGASAAGGSAGLGNISVAGISITDGTLNYRDEADQSHYRIDDLDLTTGAIENGEPFNLQASFNGHDLADNAGGRLKLRARATLDSTADATAVTLADLSTSVDLRDIAGMATLSGKVSSPSLQVRLADDTQVAADEVTTDLKLAPAGLPDASMAAKAVLGGFRYDADAGAGALAGLKAVLHVPGTDVEVTMSEPGTFGDRTRLRGQLQFAEFSPRAALVQLHQPVPSTTDANVLKRLSGKADWFVGDTEAGVDNLAMTLDDSRISGSVSRELPKEGSKAIPRIRFDLDIDALDVDRYLEPEEGAGQATKEAAGKPTAAEEPTAIPVDTIRGLNLDGRARFGKLRLDGMQLSAVDVRATAGGGRLVLAPLSAKLYGGSVDGTVSIDASGATPRVALKQAFRHIDMTSLLGDFADFRKVSGTMTLKLDAAGSGKTDDAVIRSLAGNLDFSLADGVYQGLDVWYEIRKARALIRRIPPPEPSSPARTPINALSMSGRITDGTLHTDNLTAEIPFLRVSGKADIDLSEKSLGSELTALVFEKPVFGDDTSLEDLVNARIPLTIKGPLDDPKVRVDLQKMVKGALKESLRDLLRDKLGLGSPEEPAAEKPAEGSPGEAPAQPAPKKEDRLKKALDKLLRG